MHSVYRVINPIMNASVANGPRPISEHIVRSELNVTNNPASNQLALLIAAPHPGDAAMYNDMIAMATALRRRGLQADHILSWHGPLDRPSTSALLQLARRPMQSWTTGSLFLHFSGHGFCEPESGLSGISFGQSDGRKSEHRLSWGAFFDELDVSDRIRVFLLPDL